MEGGNSRIWERLAQIQSSCEQTRDAAAGQGRREKSDLLKQQKEMTAAFMDRMQDERDNGKNEALRQFAGTAYSFFSEFRSAKEENTALLLRTGGMNRKDAEEESLILSQEYLLDMVEQSLRLICMTELDQSEDSC